MLNPWSTSLNSGDSTGGLFGSLLVLPLAYGGVHLSAWNFEFPTAIESLLWKLSAIIIAISFPTWLTITAFLETLTRWHKFNDYLFVLSAVVSMVCRVYIVIEAYVSLRAVPIGVYWTPAWIQMIPHV